MKVSSYNLKITLPTDLKSITDVFLFLLAYIHSYFVRGYLIDSDTLMKSLENLFASSVVKQTKVGVHIMKYLLWTLNNHIALTNSNSTKSGAYWYYDRPAFIKRAETFQNSNKKFSLFKFRTFGGWIKSYQHITSFFNFVEY